MTCSHGRVDPSLLTKLRLFADSGGYCGNPSCNDSLFHQFDDKIIHIAEMAHIISAGDTGPRADATLDPNSRSQYDNLILLCPSCHTKIDKAEESFPENLIKSWKANHKARLDELFGTPTFNSRTEAAAGIAPLRAENHYIFMKYGPEGESRFDPESSLPAEWRRKIRTIIIPNNRKLLSMLDANRGLLNEAELPLLEEFRQHVDDFEAKHLVGVEKAGTRFPQNFDRIFKD